MSPRTRNVLAAALLAPLLLVGGVATAAEAPASRVLTETETPAVEGEITWGLEPADAEGEPTGEVSYRLSLDPGETVTEHALVTNYSEVPVTFDVLAADGVVSADGNFDILRADEESVDIGTWIEIQDAVTIEAGESALVPWTLTVPENATPGDHPGGIVASITQTAAGEGPQVGFATRVGLRIHLRVKGEIAPVVTFSDVQTRYEASLNPFAPGDLHIDYTMSNEGNVRLGSIQQYEVFGLFRLPAGGVGPSGTVVSQQREILPGQSARVSTVIEDVWPMGRLTTELSAFNDSVGADIVGPEIISMRASDVTWAVPWTQLAVILLLVLAWWLWRRSRQRKAAAHARALEEARAAGAREAAQAEATTTETDDADTLVVPKPAATDDDARPAGTAARDVATGTGTDDAALSRGPG